MSGGAKPGGDAAAQPPNEQEELDMLDVERESLLDVVLAKARSLGIQEKIQRVLIALTYAKASDSGQEVAAEIAANISQLEVADEQGANITGISLLMPGVCLSLIEGPQRLVIGLLRAFQAPNSRMRLLTSTRHMFLSVQDAPKRSFPLYHCSAVKLDAAAPTVPDAEQAVKMVPEISVNLLKFGCDISELDGDERNGALANVKAHLGEGMPRLSDVLGLTQSSDILTLDDFFDIYYNPTKCFGSPLDSELVWPLPPALNF